MLRKANCLDSFLTNQVFEASIFNL